MMTKFTTRPSGFLAPFLVLVTLVGCGVSSPDVVDVGSPGDVGNAGDVAHDARAASDAGPCERSCGSAVCGSDGCGGTCGGCGASDTCEAGVCVPVSNEEGCPPTGPFGAVAGDTVSNVTLYDCEGNAVELHSLCARRVSLIYSFAEWCPGCRDVLRDQMLQGHAALSERGDLSTWVVLTATDDGSPVDPTSCQQVQDEFGVNVPGVTMLHDPEGQLNSVLGMRINESALVLKRRSTVVWNRASTWRTMDQFISRAFDETSP